MNAAGIIFSNLHDNSIRELTKKRTMASIPFACRYRLIDFALSNMVNSGITNINVIAHYNYHSLMDHIGTGKDWDLARRTGGIKILPPYINAYANTSNHLYNTRLEALKSVHYSIQHIQEKYIVLSDCDVICNLDISELLKYHIENDAEVTVVVKSVTKTEPSNAKHTIFKSDKDNKVTDVYTARPELNETYNEFMNIWVMNKDLLIREVSNAIAHDYESFSRDILGKNIGNFNMQVYKHTGFCASINSFQQYYTTSMELLENKDIRDSLFSIEERPILTKVRNSAPTKYVGSSCVTDSLIADGCIIEGEVDNCILFRGVKIGHGAVVKNSILFQDTIVSDNVFLNCVVTDKNAVIRDGRVLSGHETMPIYVDKGRMI